MPVCPSSVDVSQSYAQLAAGFGIGTTTVYRYKATSDGRPPP